MMKTLISPLSLFRLNEMKENYSPYLLEEDEEDEEGGELVM